MKANVSSLQLFYLRWAGLASAVLGLVSFFVVVLAYRENDPGPKLLLGIFGFVGAVIGYAIGKDIMDRIRNHEVSVEMLANTQARFAYVGTRFGFALSKVILFITFLFLLTYLYSPLERAIFIFCDPYHGGFHTCVHDYTGIWLPPMR